MLDSRISGATIYLFRDIEAGRGSDQESERIREIVEELKQGQGFKGHIHHIREGVTEYERDRKPRRTHPGFGNHRRTATLYSRGESPLAADIGTAKGIQIPYLAAVRYAFQVPGHPQTAARSEAPVLAFRTDDIRSFAASFNRLGYGYMLAAQSNGAVHQYFSPDLENQVKRAQATR